jgi:hypothetical protein
MEQFIFDLDSKKYIDRQNFVNEFMCPCNNRLINKFFFKRHIESKIHKQYIKDLTYNSFPVSIIYSEIKVISEYIEKTDFYKLLKYYIELKFNVKDSTYKYISYLHYTFNNNEWILENFCKYDDFDLFFLFDSSFSDCFDFFYFLEWDKDYHTKFDICKDYTYQIHKDFYNKSINKKSYYKRELVKLLCSYYLNSGIIHVFNKNKINEDIIRIIIKFIM